MINSLFIILMSVPGAYPKKDSETENDYSEVDEGRLRRERERKRRSRESRQTLAKGPSVYRYIKSVSDIRKEHYKTMMARIRRTGGNIIYGSAVGSRQTVEENEELWKRIAGEKSNPVQLEIPKSQAEDPSVGRAASALYELTEGSWFTIGSGQDEIISILEGLDNQQLFKVKRFYEDHYSGRNFEEDILDDLKFDLKPLNDSDYEQGRALLAPLLEPMVATSHEERKWNSWMVGVESDPEDYDTAREIIDRIRDGIDSPKVAAKRVAQFNEVVSAKLGMTENGGLSWIGRLQNNYDSGSPEKLFLIRAVNGKTTKLNAWVDSLEIALLTENSDIIEAELEKLFRKGDNFGREVLRSFNERHAFGQIDKISKSVYSELRKAFGDDSATYHKFVGFIQSKSVEFYERKAGYARLLAAKTKLAFDGERPFSTLANINSDEMIAVFCEKDPDDLTAKDRDEFQLAIRRAFKKNYQEGMGVAGNFFSKVGDRFKSYMPDWLTNLTGNEEAQPEPVLDGKEEINKFFEEYQEENLTKDQIRQALSYGERGKLSQAETLYFALKEPKGEGLEVVRAILQNRTKQELRDLEEQVSALVLEFDGEVINEIVIETIAAGQLNRTQKRELSILMDYRMSNVEKLEAQVRNLAGSEDDFEFKRVGTWVYNLCSERDDHLRLSAKKVIRLLERKDDLSDEEKAILTEEIEFQRSVQLNYVEGRDDARDLAATAVTMAAGGGVAVGVGRLAMSLGTVARARAGGRALGYFGGAVAAGLVGSEARWATKYVFDMETYDESEKSLDKKIGLLEAGLPVGTIGIARQFATKTSSRILTYGVEGAVGGAGVEGGIAYLESAENGELSSNDWKRVGTAAAFGAVGDIVGSGLGSGASNLLSGPLEKLVRPLKRGGPNFGGLNRPGSSLRSGIPEGPTESGFNIEPSQSFSGRGRWRPARSDKDFEKLSKKEKDFIEVADRIDGTSISEDDLNEMLQEALKKTDGSKRRAYEYTMEQLENALREEDLVRTKKMLALLQHIGAGDSGFHAHINDLLANHLPSGALTAELAQNFRITSKLFGDQSSFDFNISPKMQREGSEEIGDIFRYGRTGVLTSMRQSVSSLRNRVYDGSNQSVLFDIDFTPMGSYVSLRRPRFDGSENVAIRRKNEFGGAFSFRKFFESSPLDDFHKRFNRGEVYGENRWLSPLNPRVIKMKENLDGSISYRRGWWDVTAKVEEGKFGNQKYLFTGPEGRFIDVPLGKDSIESLRLGRTELKEFDEDEIGKVLAGGGVWRGNGIEARKVMFGNQEFVRFTDLRVPRHEPGLSTRLEVEFADGRPTKVMDQKRIKLSPGDKIREITRKAGQPEMVTELEVPAVSSESLEVGGVQLSELQILNNKIHKAVGTGVEGKYWHRTKMDWDDASLGLYANLEKALTKRGVEKSDIIEILDTVRGPNGLVEATEKIKSLDLDSRAEAELIKTTWTRQNETSLARAINHELAEGRLLPEDARAFKQQTRGVYVGNGSLSQLWAGSSFKFNPFGVDSKYLGIKLSSDDRVYLEKLFSPAFLQGVNIDVVIVPSTKNIDALRGVSKKVHYNSESRILEISAGSGRVSRKEITKVVLDAVSDRRFQDLKVGVRKSKLEDLAELQKVSDRAVYDELEQLEGFDLFAKLAELKKDVNLSAGLAEMLKDQDLSHLSGKRIAAGIEAGTSQHPLDKGFKSKLDSLARKDGEGVLQFFVNKNFSEAEIQIITQAMHYQPMRRLNVAVVNGQNLLSEIKKLKLKGSDLISETNRLRPSDAELGSLTTGPRGRGPQGFKLAESINSKIDSGQIDHRKLAWLKQANPELYTITRLLDQGMDETEVATIMYRKERADILQKIAAGDGHHFLTSAQKDELRWFEAIESDLRDLFDDPNPFPY